ncbi:MAG: hypothetical protein ACJAZO_001976 [Myxococcota bacterium]
MAYSYDLVVTEGPLVGRSFRVETHTTLKIGRTCRDVPLFQDERASLEHAELSWTKDGFWVRDLASEGGTFVDGLPIPKVGRALHVDSSLRVGQTVMRLEESRSVPAWAGWSAAVGIPLGAVIIGLIALAVRGVSYEPEVRFAAPIAQGEVTSERVAVPLWFMRRFGIDHRNLRSRRVTDFDADGRSELWFPFLSSEVVVEIQGDDWSVVAELPTECSDRPGLAFPDQECVGRRLRMVEGTYVAVELSSPVAWIAPLADSQPEDDAPIERGPGQPQPFRVSVAQLPRLSGFLRERGVSEPIHYLVCEGVFPGVYAQVLTESGQIQRLESGCLGAMSTSGPGLNPSMSREDPVAVAFTANGYDALRRDALTYRLGDPDGFFHHEGADPRLDAFLAVPDSRAIRVSFDSGPIAQVAVADEARLVGVRHWVHSDDSPSSPPMLMASIDSPGSARFDLPGCAVVEIQTEGWHCLLRRWCRPGSVFLTAHEVGCTDEPRALIAAPYWGGVQVGAVDGLEMWTDIDVYGFTGQIDVNRVRVGFRDTRGVPTP